MQEGDSATDIMASSTSFLPLPSRGATEDEAIQSTINGIDPLEWPTIGDNPISEFKTAGLASMAFPTLFPHGRWTVRAESMCSIINNYHVLQELWDQAAEIVHDSETVARIRGVAAQM